MEKILFVGKLFFNMFLFEKKSFFFVKDLFLFLILFSEKCFFNVLFVEVL